VIPYCRATVAEMTEAAARKLPEGVYIGLMEAWRPLERQQRIYDFMLKSARETFPTRDHASLRRTICRWVAPTDQKAPPGHCTGGAVDVWLLNEAGEQLDVTSPFDRFHAARTYTLGLSDAAQRNRDILLDAMLGVGFSNCRDEWWHYSYGDAGWAVRTARSGCCYGLVRIEPELFAEEELLWAEAAKDRKNPFV
jgi:D-alanyl-D-alanine dipeptidase